MEELIKQAFLHVDIIGPHVHQGRYDLIGPDGEIILPQVWEMMIQPDWLITMHMWPMPEPPATLLETSIRPKAKKRQSNQNKAYKTTSDSKAAVSPPPPLPPSTGSQLTFSPLPFSPSSRGRTSVPGGFFAWAAGGKAAGSNGKSSKPYSTSSERLTTIKADNRHASTPAESSRAQNGSVDSAGEDTWESVES